MGRLRAKQPKGLIKLLVHNAQKYKLRSEIYTRLKQAGKEQRYQVTDSNELIKGLK